MLDLGQETDSDGRRGEGSGEWFPSAPRTTCLPEHLWEVVHVGGPQGLRLEALGLEQVLGDVRRVDQHPVQTPLLVAEGVKHNLDGREMEGGGGVAPR